MKQDSKFGQLPQRSLKLSLGSPGLLSTLQFEDDKEVLKPLENNEIEVSIKYVGVNYHDIVTALGQVNEDVLGLEGAGLVARAGLESGFKIGDQVCGLFFGSWRTYARTNAKLAYKVPENVDLHVAAAVPVVFCTAYHALTDIARLQPAETILIHSAAGGLGQAAIQLAQLKDADIFVTVGTAEKKDLLVRLYNIKEDHVFSSRSTSFVHSISMLTNGRGVDVIVNSLPGEGRRASLECIAPFGRFIEVGLKDTQSFGTIPISSFATDTLFASVKLLQLMRQKPDTVSTLMENVIDLLGAAKIFGPQPLPIYGVAHLEDAFRHMQSGKGFGKLVTELRAEDSVQVSHDSIYKISQI